MHSYVSRQGPGANDPATGATRIRPDAVEGTSGPQTSRHAHSPETPQNTRCEQLADVTTSSSATALRMANGEPACAAPLRPGESAAMARTVATSKSVRR